MNYKKDNILEKWGEFARERREWNSLCDSTVKIYELVGRNLSEFVLYMRLTDDKFVFSYHYLTSSNGGTEIFNFMTKNLNQKNSTFSRRSKFLRTFAK